MKRLALLICLSTALGCPAAPVEPPPSDPSLPPPVTGELVPSGDAEVVPDFPEADEGIRPRRRMDLFQLEAALLAVSGGEEWTDGDTLLFDELAATLGKPDYLDVTSWDLEPSMLFQKFLGDAARDICQKTAESDVLRAEEDRVLLRHVGPEDTLETHPSQVASNLQYLLLRYHSVALATGSEQLNSWSWLFESALHVTGEPVDAWRTVCVGLVTHPEFYTY